LSYEILKEQTIQWPYKKKNPAKGTPRYLPTNFLYPKQKRPHQSVADTLNSELPDDDFPFILTTGRIRDQWHTMSKTGKVNKLNQHY
jgi:ferredoxin-nitrate reductase